MIASAAKGIAPSSDPLIAIPLPGLGCALLSRSHDRARRSYCLAISVRRFVVVSNPLPPRLPEPNENDPGQRGDHEQKGGGPEDRGIATGIAIPQWLDKETPGAVGGNGQ